MAFLRFTRDKRGYEYFYLVHSSQRRGRSMSRVLYWFRTPPNVKVGREPFDEHIRRELEKQNPDVDFDWRKILETPIPSADAEKWRERRRAERAAKVLRRAEVPETEPGDEEEGSEAPALEAAEDVSAAEPELALDDEPMAETAVHVLEAAAAAVPLDSAIPPDLSAPAASNQAVHQPNAPADLRTVGSLDRSRGRRRRRRRRRGQSGSSGSEGGPPAGPAGDV
jgi:hypothetical protein